MNPIPATTDVLLDQIRALGAFSSWSGSSAFRVEQIKAYCVPGNAKQAKGRMAVWVRGPAAKRPRILFPELVLRAMRFIAEPQRRGSRQHLSPGIFAMSVTGADAKLPGVLQNDEIYLALARRLLGLPDDHVDPTTERLETEQQQRWDDRHPDIRTIAGLQRETLLAYAESLSWQESGTKTADWVDLAYRTLFKRQGTSAWRSSEAQHRTDLAAVLEDIRSNPTHADIRDIEVAVFAMLYTTGLCMAGKVRASAVTTVVNSIADAADDGVLDNLKRLVEKDRAAENAAFAKLFQGALRRRGLR
ncbi:MAG: hypothetical protein H0W72_09560 [Planctomycetes bacterium]|nr:hypothetical protein [Planctomycetota bacterium]